MTPAPEKAAPILTLLPCPFCGGRAETWALEHPEIQGGEDGQYQGGCAVACAETPWCDTIEEVAEWWNRRADREARPSLPDSREEQDGFNRGYLIAVANVMNMHRDAVVASELLVQLGVTIDDAEALGLTDYDMDALKRLRSEPRAAPFFNRKLRARARQGGNNG